MNLTINTCDPEVAETICGTIVIIIAIAAATILLWKLISCIAEGCKARRTRKSEVEDAKRKQIAEFRKEEYSLMEKKEEKLEKLGEYIKDLKS